MRKVKGTIHWLSAEHAVPITAMLYDTLVIDDPKAPEGFVLNPSSIVVSDGAFGEPYLGTCDPDDRFQFMRLGYFCPDNRAGGGRVFNRTVSLKSSYRP